MFVEPLDIEPKEVASPKTGEVTTITSLPLVRMADETIEQAARLYGVVPRKPRLEVEPSGVGALPTESSSGSGWAPSSTGT